MPSITQGKINFKSILLIIILAAIISGGILGYQYWWLPKTEIPVSTLIFDKTANWKTYRNEEYGYEFRYPEELGQKYIRVYRWPPEVTVEPINPNFICEESQELKTSQGYGSQKKVTFDNSNYCVLTVSSAAAGTAYITYRYTTNRENRQLTIEFILTFPTCGNYGFDNKTEECQQEEKNFELTALINKMLSTFRFLE